MKSEILTTPDRLHNVPDSPGGPLDTREMRRLRDQLAEEESIEQEIEDESESESEVENGQGEVKTEYEAINAAWDNVEQEDPAMSPESYTPEEALALVEELDRMHGGTTDESSVTEKFKVEDLSSLESDFSDVSAFTEVNEASAPIEATDTQSSNNVEESIYTKQHAEVAAARGRALMQNYKPSGVPLGYDPRAPRPQVKQPTPKKKTKKKGWFARLFGG